MAKNRIVFSNDFTLKDEKIGINTSAPKATLDVVGDVYFSGVTTSLGGFVGDLIGNITGTITGTASTASSLETPRTFEITGDVVASPITFDGTGNVSLAATIQPNSVGLGTDTFGDYVKNISGTTNQITVTGGTGEGSTPVISIPDSPVLPGNVTVANDLQVNNNLNVNGNITVGGTTAIIYAQEFIVSDKEIVLGFTTDSFGNEVSNDTTADGGGISIASTEGNPLVDFNIAGIHTHPNTYKDIIWIKAGTLGAGTTDAWHFNYGVGIGSTQVPNGVRFAVSSIQFTDDDLTVIRNINASGIITANTFYGDGSNLDNITATSGNVNYANIAGIATYATTAGISTAAEGLTGTPNLNVGIVTATEYYGTFKGTIDSGVTLDSVNYANVAGIATYAVTAGVATYAGVSGIATYSTTSGIATYATTAGISTAAEGLTGTPNLNVGIVTATEYYGTFKGTIDSGVTLDSVNYANSSGISTNVKGTANRVLYNSATDTTSTSSNLTFDGGILGVGGTVTANRYRITTGNNLFVGNEVGVAVTSEMAINPIIALGYNSLRNFQATGSGGGSNTCEPQIAIGYGCMENFDFNTLGNGSRTFGTNIVMGYQSGKTLQRLTDGSTARNVIFGYQNVYENNFGAASLNSIFGVQSGYKLTSSIGNALFGYQSGYNVTSGSYNVFNGYQAGYSNVTGSYNIGIGYSAGQANMTGSRNIVIGYNRDVPNAAGNDQLVIGSNANDWIIGDSSYNVGIGTDAIDTSVKLTVGGAVTATTYYGDGSQLSGIQGGFSISTETSNQAQYIPYATSFGSTTGLGATTLYVFNPATTRLGIGTTNPQYNLQVVGDFAATSKSFVIDHPTKPGKKLRYASLEGPEQGVYVRGRSQEAVIDLPDYWTGLVDEESITVNLTPIGRSATPRVESINQNSISVFTLEEGDLDYYYTVYAERKDIEKLVVEY